MRIRDPADHDTPDLFAPPPVRREPRLSNCFLCQGEMPCQEPYLCPEGTDYKEAAR